MPEHYEHGENPEVDSVLRALRQAGLRYPAYELIWCFISSAKKPLVAARYAKQRMEDGGPYLMVSDWAYIIQSITDKATMPEPLDKYDKKTITNRDHGRCCITGYKGTLWDPLVFAPVLKVPTGWRVKGDNNLQNRITTMLYAFFGRTYGKWWLRQGGWAMGSEVASHLGGIQPRNSHWLVRKSAAEAFNRGIVKLDSIKESEVEYKITKNQLLGPLKPIDSHYYFTQDVVLGGMAYHGHRVNWRFFDTHSRLSLSMRYVEIAKDIAPEILHEGVMSRMLCDKPAGQSESPLPSFTPQPPRKPFFVTALVGSALLAIWLLFPVKFRAYVYEKLRDLGDSLHDKRYLSTRDRSWNWFSLPFGLQLQFKRLSHPVNDYSNEFNALQMVRQHTTIPVPKPLDNTPGPVVEQHWGCGPGYPSRQHTLVTQLPGLELYHCLDFMSDAHIREVAAQLRDYISQLRKIPKTVNPGMAICSSLGERVGGKRCQKRDNGPFVDEDAFSKILKFPDDPCRHGNKIVFSHGSLNANSVLVDRYVRPDGTTGWKVTGIVNWKSAGWYPEYWEYTTSVYNKSPYRHGSLMSLVFEGLGDYKRHMEIERQSWKLDRVEISPEHVRRVAEWEEHNKATRKAYLESVGETIIEEREDEGAKDEESDDEGAKKTQAKETQAKETEAEETEVKAEGTEHEASDDGTEEEDTSSWVVVRHTGVSAS